MFNIVRFFVCRYFNNRFHYPVVLFCEKDLFNDVYFERIRSFTNSTIFFQQVVFKLPLFLTKPVPAEIIGMFHNYVLHFYFMHYQWRCMYIW